MKKTLFPNLFSLTSVALTLALALSSCSWLGLGEDDEDVKEEMENKLPADEMYKGAEDLLDKGKAIKAIEQFQEVERLYPFSQYANKAKVMEAYAQYLNEEYDKAIDVVDEFVSLNPGNEEIEFMYYLKAICYYDRIQDVKRDQEVTRRAQSSFEELINRFPQSKYARDAQYKLDLIRDHLAAKDMEVGRFYMKQKNYIAALNRFKDVVKNYDTTQQIEEALYRLTEANLLLGFDKEALRYSAILGYNYSSSKWYKRAYALVGKGKVAEGDDKTFVGKVLDTFGLGAEPESYQPVDLQSSPNLIDTGGWISDDSAIAEEANPAGDMIPQEAAPEGNTEVAPTENTPAQ